MELSLQYNNFAQDFSKHANGDDLQSTNKYSREVFYRQLGFVKPNMKLLDLGCGDGTDMLHYKSLGADVAGIDASQEMLELAKRNIPEAEIRLGVFEQIPFADESFDIVLSKYAIQTSENISPIFPEIHRVLKPGGTMMYLTVHPFRQYFERKENNGNYFEQRIVDSHVFQNQITFKEPTHTIGEYFSNFLFENFDVKMFDEHWEPCAEQIDGKKYPGFFIIKAMKR